MKSSDPIRPSSRRGASGAWNRLKPVREDVLESYGLPSKGETRLNDFRTQETFLNRITERYMKLCALNRSDLESIFAAVNLNPTSTSLSTNLSSLSLSKHAPPKPAPLSGANSPALLAASKLSAQELSTVLSALRKLREGVTASGRADAFAHRAYFFTIHVSILCKDWASYLPALHTLLYSLHPRNPLTSSQLQEYAGYQILDQACRQGDLAGARETKVRFAYKDRRVEGILGALVSDNWVQFWRCKRGVDGYQRALCGFAEQGVRVNALKVIGKSYLVCDRRWVEDATGKGWEGLVADGVGWELEEGRRVVVRRVKAKG
ncbi:hypothetical protein BU25DRAFT_400689 [Macroventuria anomochaeta]|uniref:Uncharacterized protein n=1 Tax=Macroventuria anomochaeta TaxID=301207 RepID=A0ACB6RQQ6_9PLEO|nr:uncharacterized protein BU25DRAFT_400689 [Macroventuria anomochaeta]KAF2623607.1 hypothetical protein BU25DRAFT_400689 [Macroventuria anomochaeta]